MADYLRKLNDEGMRQFRDYIRDGASGHPPIHLLISPETSESLPFNVKPDIFSFSDRYEFGQYLNKLFEQFNPATLSGDQGLWTACALFWFDEICPPTSTGNRKVDKDYRYILSSDYRHYYRHAVRSPWKLVRDHGENSKLLLISPLIQKHPLSVHGEIMEQIGGRQQLLGSTPILSAANALYFDPIAGKPKKGVAGRGKGSANRFGMVLRQFDLTYDPESMSNDSLVSLLPSEFSRWKWPKIDPVQPS